MDQIARTPKQLGAALRRRRRNLGMSQAALGAKTRMRQATISSLERGEAGTRLNTLADVMSALGLELVIRDRTKAEDKIEDLY